MDRNNVQPRKTEVPGVALRKESVDRNPGLAWKLTVYPVALRKESVDRNPPVDTSSVKVSLSLSARRAWIEIEMRHSVYRGFGGRSPQGERG